MYAKLLAAALADRPSSEIDEDPGSLLSEVKWRHSLLDSSAHNNAISNSAPVALADELAYDIALIALARSAGIQCDVNGFDQPVQQRLKLEQEVARQGIKIFDSDKSTQYSS